MFALPARPATAPTLTIFPCPAASIFGTTARATLITDFALRSSMSSQMFSGVWCTGCPMRKPPAILHRTSIPGNRTPATACATDAASRRSARTRSLRSSSRPKADRRTLSSRSTRTREAPADAKAAASARPRLPAAPVIRQVLPSNVTVCGGGPAGLSDLLRVFLAGFRPVSGRSLRLGKRLGVFEPRRHGCRGACEHLVVVDVEQAKPALLPHGERDEAAQLDQLGFAEMPVEPFPERVIGVQVPGDCLGVRKRRFLALVVIAGLLEVQQVLDVILHDGAASGRLDRALIAAVFALNGARYVEPAQLFDGVVTHAVLEDIAPGVGKGPEAFGHMRAHRGALWPGRALSLAALHLLAHFRVHLFQRNVADSLLCHGCPRRPHPAGLSNPVVRSLPLRRRGCKVDGVDWAAALTGLPQSAEASLRLDAGRLDDAGVFPEFALHEYLEFFRRHVHGVVAQADEPVPHRRVLERLARVGRDLVHDPRRDARRAPQCEPQRRIGAFDTRFAGGRYVRQLAVALRRAHRERPNPAALDVRYRRRDRRPIGIHRLA